MQSKWTPITQAPTLRLRQVLPLHLTHKLAWLKVSSTSSDWEVETQSDTVYTPRQVSPSRQPQLLMCQPHSQETKTPRQRLKLHSHGKHLQTMEAIQLLITPLKWISQTQDPTLRLRQEWLRHPTPRLVWTKEHNINSEWKLGTHSASVRCHKLSLS